VQYRVSSLILGKRRNGFVNGKDLILNIDMDSIAEFYLDFLKYSFN